MTTDDEYSSAVIPVLVTGTHAREFSSIGEDHGVERGTAWIPVTGTGMTVEVELSH